MFPATSNQQICFCLLMLALFTGAQSYAVPLMAPEVPWQETDTDMKRLIYTAPRQGKRVNYKTPIRRSNFYYNGPRGKKRSSWSPRQPSATEYYPDVDSTGLNVNKRAERFTLSAADYQLLLRNRDRLLRMLAMNRTHDGLLDMGYFAFPRQGRAMSFYFPRMGRSGEGVAAQGSQCCERGVKTVFSGIRGSFEICPRDQPCCEGLEERTKLYMDLVITDCAQSSSLEKIRQIMTNE